MTDQAAAPSAKEPKDARDILAHLYREIGISAVAAALQATAPKPEATKARGVKASWAPRGKNGLAA